MRNKLKLRCKVNLDGFIKNKIYTCLGRSGDFIGLEDDATKDEISETVDEWVMQNISWGYEIIDEG